MILQGPVGSGAKAGRWRVQVRRVQDAYMDEAAVAEFAAVHRGPVIGPADVRFDGARRSFNALVEARPELVVRPVGDADVAAAIGLARARGLGVSVRGGATVWPAIRSVTPA
jgi:FAD/FMN-containing dehydrogenase